ncbi:transcription factor bHLH157-like [Abrus precatorius]|uniref:Transcription factor bHLH157-like n=1 Tax=Abrus precatorius TaxID=3816 RepID=A0A8B8M9U5_ABRPR|nr:transcription factor bHLH157-like [Abrus precatorius]
MPLNLRNKLKTLCACGDGWSYAIFWRFHPKNSLLLTLEEAYYEEQLGEEIVNMLPQVHLLGEGIVGEAAFAGKHSWVHSDGPTQEWNLKGQNICEEFCFSLQDDSGLHQQFSSGIKTIVVIPVKAWGVVQFGSRQKILERVEFLEQTQSLLMEVEDDMGVLDVSENAILSLDCENSDLNGLLAPISFENSYHLNSKHAQDENSIELLRKFFTSSSSNGLFSSEYKTYEDGMISLQGDSSCVGDEPQVVFSDKDSTDLLLKPNSSVDSLIAKIPSFGACSGEVSSFDMLEQQLVSEIRAQEVAVMFSTEENAFDSSTLLAQDSELTSLDRESFQDKLQNSLDNQHCSQSSIVTDVNFQSSLNTLHGFSENLEPIDMSEEILKFSSMDDLCHWFSLSQQDSICKTGIALDNTLSESIEFNPTSFDLVEINSLNDTSVTCLAGHNSNSDGKETSVAVHGYENGLLDDIELDFSYDQADEWWRNMLTPVVSAAIDSGLSECISELNTDTQTCSRKRLFSELGIEEHLTGGTNYSPFNSSHFKYELSSNKKQMVESPLVNRNPAHLTNLHRDEAKADLMMQPLCDLDSTNNLLSKNDSFMKFQVGMWVDDSHSINIGRAAQVHPQKPAEPTKPTRKRARPGESTRPRPKDRQQIQDCIKELRGIIPNGGKCSIDSLLDRTIRYMLFLQSVLKYADKLQEPNEPKVTDQASKNCGITWAFEVAQQTMLCPIIVEDMSSPGQMLIELLCEEQGFFLEIVDIIRGFGLNILKAKMEIRKNKLWARFIVEADRHVTRIDVFLSLIHLLQQTNTSNIDSAKKHCNVIDANVS